jgi:hypothetical protein
MGNLEIKRVVTRRDLKEFVNFPFRLYRDSEFWCPPLKSEEINVLRRDKNPAFEYCEAEYWLACRDGKTEGRIAGIINHKEHARWGNRLVRFGWFDFVDDPEVSSLLIETVSEWGLSKGMTGIHGPLGFTDMDPEGMIVEGFDEPSSLSALYNYPYYIDHMQRQGFQKAAEWVQFEIRVPEAVPEKIERMTRIVMQKYDLHLLKPRTPKEILPYAGKLFGMYNEAFNDLYGFTSLTQRQIEDYTRQYFKFIRPEFVSIVLDSRDDVVGFGISMPSLFAALKKANGSLFPFGFYHILRAIRKNKIIHMYLVGVRPDYQGKGLLALVYHELTKAYIRAGMKIALTHPQLENNLRAVSIWKNYEHRVNIRRYCWIRSFAGHPSAG